MTEEYKAFEVRAARWAVEHLTTGYIYGIRFTSKALAELWIVEKCASSQLGGGAL